MSKVIRERCYCHPLSQRFLWHLLDLELYTELRLYYNKTLNHWSLGKQLVLIFLESRCFRLLCLNNNNNNFIKPNIIVSGWPTPQTGNIEETSGNIESRWKTNVNSFSWDQWLTSCSIGINSFWVGLAFSYVFWWEKPFSADLVDQLFQPASNQGETV